jgi:hypothetical protein
LGVVDAALFDHFFEWEGRVVAQGLHRLDVVGGLDYHGHFAERGRNGRALAQGFSTASRRISSFVVIEFPAVLTRDGVGALDLDLQLHDAVQQHFRRRRAARHVDVGRYDAVAAALPSTSRGSSRRRCLRNPTR